MGEVADGAGAGEAERLPLKAGDGIAVVLVGADEVAFTGHGLGVVEEIALDALTVAVGRLEDAHLVASVCVHHSGDAGGVVGLVRLKGAGAQSIGEALALAHLVKDGVGLVTVGYDMGLTEGQHGVIDDKAGVLELGRVGSHGADAAALRHRVEDAVAAVLAAAHDEIADEHLTAIRSLCHRDAAAGVLVRSQIFVQVDLLHCYSPLSRALLAPPFGGAGAKRLRGQARLRRAASLSSPSRLK